MCDGQRQGVSRVRGRQLRQVQQHLDHVRDLRLFGATPARQRLLDASGGVFGQLDAGSFEHQQHYSARVPQL